MKVVVVGKEKKIVEKEIPKVGLKLEKRNPDLVISFGGDGTALYAERLYPGIPRLMIKHRENEKVERKKLLKVLSALKEKNFKIREEIKVEGIINNNPKKKLIGLNEIGIHHRIPTKAIRLRVKVDGRIVANEVIGDGIVVATPYGSTAYFYSITRKKFSKGLGLAFNNSREFLKPLILNEDSVVEAEVLRGYGLVTADNDERMIPVEKGDLLRVKKSEEKAKLIELKI